MESESHARGIVHFNDPNDPTLARKLLYYHQYWTIYQYHRYEEQERGVMTCKSIELK